MRDLFGKLNITRVGGRVECTKMLSQLNNDWTVIHLIPLKCPFKITCNSQVVPILIHVFKGCQVSTPTSRSLKFMRDQGFYSEVVERYNSFTKRRNDFAGFIDILCLGDGVVIGIQTTSYSNISSRVKKIKEHENLDAVRKAGIKISVHGWRKVKNRWEVKVVEIE